MIDALGKSDPSISEAVCGCTTCQQTAVTGLEQQQMSVSPFKGGLESVTICLMCMMLYVRMRAWCSRGQQRETR